MTRILGQSRMSPLMHLSRDNQLNVRETREIGLAAYFKLTFSSG